MPPQQVVQVSMVAPSILREEASPVSAPVKQQTKLEKPKTSVKKKAMLKRQELQPKPPKQKSIAPSQPSIGKVSPQAENQVSAYTKPIAAHYLNNPPPDYPEKARLRRQQGSVLLQVRVKTNGLPRQVHLIRSSGYPLLDQTAMTTVRRWRFVPGRRGSTVVEANVEVPITFRID